MFKCEKNKIKKQRALALVLSLWSIHGQNLANRTKPWLSFQLKMWGCIHIEKYVHKAKQPNLQSKTQPNQVLGSLLLAFMLHGLAINFILNRMVSCKIFTHLATLQSARSADSKSPHPSPILTIWSHGSRPHCLGSLPHLI